MGRALSLGLGLGEKEQRGASLRWFPSVLREENYFFFAAFFFGAAFFFAAFFLAAMVQAP